MIHKKCCFSLVYIHSSHSFLFLTFFQYLGSINSGICVGVIITFNSNTAVPNLSKEIINKIGSVRVNVTYRRICAITVTSESSKY